MKKTLLAVLSFILAMLGLTAIGVILLWIADWRTLEIPKQKEQYLGEFKLSRYYSPVVGQKKYYTNRKADLEMNCGSTSEADCVNTANWHTLENDDIWVLYSCPETILLWSKIKLEFHWGTVYGTCQDRGWAIKDKRLDARCGYGDEGVYNIRKWKWCFTGKAKVFIL